MIRASPTRRLSSRRSWSHRRDRACAGRRRGPGRPLHPGDRPARACRGRSAASSPPRAASPAGSPARCRRCRGRSRGRARTGRGRSRRGWPTGSIPSDPVSIADSSLRMSPNRFSVTITSKSAGRETSCMAALSTSRWSSSTSSYSAASPVDRLAPQARGLEHVRLVDRGDPAAPLARRLEGDPRDPLDLGDRVGAVVVGAVAVAAALAEVDAPGQLAHHQQVGPLDPLPAQRAGLEQRLARPHRAQVGEQAESLAQPEQALLGARGVGVGGVPLRAPDRAEQDGVGRPARLEHLVGEGGAVQVDRGAADRVLAELELAERSQQRAAAAARSPGRSRRRGAARSAGSPLIRGSRSVDVEPDVVAGQRAGPRPRAPRRRTAAASCSGSRSRCGASAPCDELMRARGLGRGVDPVSQQDDLVEPCRSQPLARCPERGEVPRRSQSPRGARRTGRPLGDGRDRLHELGATLPSPPHWATSRPPGRSACVEPSRTGASWSRIQWKVALEKTASTGSTPAAPSSERSAIRSPVSVAERRGGAVVDHRRRGVDPDHPAAGQPLDQHRRHPSGAAAGVEHGLVAVGDPGARAPPAPRPPGGSETRS